MHHAGHFDIGAKVFLAENFWRPVLALDWPANDFVLARLLWLPFTGRVKLVAELFVPVKLHVEIFAAGASPVVNEKLCRRPRSGLS